MKEEKNQVENSLKIIEKENILIRLKKWIVNIFQGSRRKDWAEDSVVTEVPSITIPKEVKMSQPKKQKEDFAENSLEYLFLLSDEELDKLSYSYDNQIAELQEETLRFDAILQNYKESIKKLQEQVIKQEN